jgi:hypothetical protein
MNDSISLYELNKEISSVLKGYLSRVWVHAEINSITVQRVGHCYIELIEKDENTGSIIAKSRANIWANIYKSIAAYFLAETGKTLVAGMKVAFCVDVTFHEVYGISLNVVDIDPTYTLGESARRKAQVIKKLEQLGWEFGYNDYHYQNTHNQSEMDFIKNISLWQNEIGKLISNPTIYANPIFNSTPLTDENKLKILSDYNFSILFENDRDCSK